MLTFPNLIIGVTGGCTSHQNQLTMNLLFIVLVAFLFFTVYHHVDILGLNKLLFSFLPMLKLQHQYTSYSCFLNRHVHKDSHNYQCQLVMSPYHNCDSMHIYKVQTHAKLVTRLGYSCSSGKSQRFGSAVYMLLSMVVPIKLPDSLCNDYHICCQSHLAYTA